MSDENKTMSPEEYIKKQMEKEAIAEKRKANVDAFLNDPDPTRKQMKEKVYNESIKARLSENPTIADNMTMLSEIYLSELKIEQLKIQHQEELAKHKQPVPTSIGTETPPPAPVSQDRTGELFKDGKLDESKVPKTVIALAKEVFGDQL